MPVVVHAKKMKNKLLILTLLIFSFSGISQTLTIKGQVLFYQSLQPMYYTHVYFDSTYQVIADYNGQFELEVPLKVLKDTLKIRYIGCFDLNLINLPTTDSIIDLGILPIFEYFAGQDMTHFNCSDNDIECKKKEKVHRDKEQKRVKEYFSRMNTIIEFFNYVYENKTFKINIENNCIDMNSELKE